VGAERGSPLGSRRDTLGANAWTATRLAATSFSLETGAPEAWAARPRKVRQIIFQTTESGNLDVAELVIEGANLGDLKR